MMNDKGSEEVRMMLAAIPELWGKAGPVYFPDATFDAVARRFTQALEDARAAPVADIDQQQRITELLQSNNEFKERARRAEREVERLEGVVRILITHLPSQPEVNWTLIDALCPVPEAWRNADDMGLPPGINPSGVLREDGT